MTETRPLVLEAVEPVRATYLPGDLTSRDAAPESPGRIFWRTFRQNRLAVAGLGLMLGVIALAIVGPWLVSADPNRIDYAAINARPSAGHPLGTSFGVRSAGSTRYPMRTAGIVSRFVGGCRLGQKNRRRADPR